MGEGPPCTYAEIQKFTAIPRYLREGGRMGRLSCTGPWGIVAAGGVAKAGREVWRADLPTDEGHQPELSHTPLSASPRAGEQLVVGLGG